MKIAQDSPAVMSVGNGRTNLVKRGLFKSISDKSLICKDFPETVAEKRLYCILVKIFKPCILHHSLIRSERPAAGHHLCKFIIIEDLALVRSILHPHDAFIIVIWLVSPLLNHSDHKAAAVNFNRVNLNQYGRNNIFRSNVTQ